MASPSASSSSEQRSSYSNRPRRRNRRGGGRNRNSNDSNHQRNGRRRSSKPQRKAPPKQSFLQKILSFFGIGGAKKKAKARQKPTKSSSRTVGQGSARAASKAAEKPRRSPELVEVTSGRLYVGNLSYDATETDLFELFKGVGQVQHAEVVANRNTHRSRGYAFVEMLSIDDARRAVEILHDENFMGRKLVVSGAKSNGTNPDDDDPS